MKFKFRHILVGLTVVFGLARSHNAFAQLPSIINISTTKASCDGVSDATLTVEFDGGNLPLSVAILGPGFLVLTYTENGPGPGPFTHTFTGLPDGKNGAGIGNYTVAVEDDLGNRINGFTVINDTEPILITANSITDVCPPSLGAINLSVSGGTAPYSLVWSGPTAILDDELSPTGLAPGSYSVDVTDANGCTASLNNMVVEDSPVATLSGDATICEGENTNLTVIISGGTGPFNITIDNGVGTINGYNSGDPIPVSPGANTTYNLLGPLTDANGCDASLNGSATVTVNPLPDATITPAGPFCEGAAPVNLVAATPGGTWSGPGITDGVNGTFDPSVAGSASSPHTITYEITDGNGCIGTDTEDIVVNAVPDATITPAGPFCEDAAPVNLVAATPGGTWSGPGITDGANGTFDPSVAGSALSPHTITYEINDGNGCIDTDTEAIVVNALPDATITPAGPFCEDAAPVNLIAATPGGTWSGPGITDAVNGTFDPSVAGSASSPHTITYEITDGNGCIGTDTEAIVVNALPDATITPAGPFCEDAAPVNLIAATPGGTWSGPGITDGTNGTFDPSVAGSASSPHTITYQITDGNGCAAMASEAIVVNALPDATITPTGPFCEDAAPINLVAATPGGTWSGPGITDGANGTFDPSVAGSALSPHTITYEITDGNGCIGTDTEAIVVHALPDATITPAGPFCEDATPVNLIAATPGGTWSGPGITDAVNGTFDPSVAGSASSPHTITYEITDGNGCIGTDTENIEVSPLSDAGVDATIDVCKSDNAVDLFAALGGTPQAGGTWNDDDGSGGLTGAIFDATVAGVTAGNTYNFTYTVSNPGCTPASATVSVNIVAQPNAGTGSTGTACVTTTNFDLFTLLSGFDPGGIWNDDDLTLALSGANNEIFDASAVGIGSYDFTYIVSSPTCPPRATMVTVNVVPNLNAGTALTNIDVCGNETAFNLFTGLTGNDAGGSWGDDDATGALTGNLFDASAVAPGSYQFTYTIAAPGCTPDSETITVDVSAAPAANAGTDQSVCSNSTFLNASLGANETGVWTVVAGTGSFTDAIDPNTEVTGLTEGVNTFQWEVTDVNTNCTEVDLVDVNFTELTLPNAGPDQNICTSFTTLAANNYDNATEVGIWSYTGPVVPAPVFVDPNDPNTQVTGLIDGQTYDFIWTIADQNPFGCGGNDDFVTIDVIGTITAADAGPDQNICDAFTTLAGNTEGANEEGTWTFTDGSGIFANANDPATSVTGLSVGINRFVWTIEALTGPCPPSTDTVTVEVGANTVANAGPDQNICTTSTTLAANGFGGNEQGAWSVVSGSAVFVDSSIRDTRVNGLSVGTNVLRWTIVDDNGVCPSTQDEVTINLIGSITAADAGPDQNICDAFTTLAGNTEGANEEGTWTFTDGSGIFANANDPATSVTGLSAGINRFVWTIEALTGPCPPSTDTVTVEVGANTVANAGPDQNICTTSTTLAANGFGGNEQGAWSVVSGSAVFVDSSIRDTRVNGLSVGTNVLRWTITDDNGVCPPTQDDVIINVLNPTDPLCSGGGINCGAFVISVTEVRPSCVNNDDGIISFGITGGSGSYTVLLTNNNGFNKGETGTSAANISFQDLTEDDYEYTVDDGAGNVCTLPYSLVRQTTVKATASDFVDVVCFGAATGEARITITEGGSAPYQYSIDGLVWNNLPPNGVVSNLPALGNFNVLVRNDVSDQCPAEVAVTIDNALQEIDLTFNTNEATCSNAGGSIEVLNVTGGLAPYRYRLDGVDFSDLPANNTFEDLTAGFHFLTVIDDNNCEKNYNVLVDAPGLVLFTSSVITPDCNGNGQNGSITIQIDPLQLPGSFEAAISTEIDEDGEFQFVPTNGIMEFSNLSVGTYYVTVVAAGGCPNKVPITINSGPVGLGFDLALECFDNRQAILLSNITAEDNTPFDIEVYRVGEISPIDVITLPDLPAGNVYRITSANFLNATGNYQLLLAQEQAVCGTSLSSDVENFTINLPLSATLGEITQSLPERGTGSIMIDNVIGGAGGYQILIEPSGGVWVDIPQNQTNQEFEFQFAELLPGAYEVFISDSLGCGIMFSVEIPRDSEIFIPNIFTPNGDNFNETFFIRNLPLDGTKLLISNRLGRKVYETDNYRNDWDGEGHADGIYYYTIQIGDEKYSGWIELWRGGIDK